MTSSQIQPSSTFGTHTTLKDIQQLPSVSSGFGSGILDSMTTKGYSLPDIQLPEPTLVPKHSNKYDFSRPINVDHDIRTKFTSRRNEIQISLASEIPKSLDGQTDSSSLNQILTESIDLIQEKKVSTYSELHDKLAHEHKQQSHLINPVVHSLYYIIENHGLDNLDKPEFSLTIRDVSPMINDILLLYTIPHSSFLSFPFNRWYVFRPNRHLTQPRISIKNQHH